MFQIYNIRLWSKLKLCFHSYIIINMQRKNNIILYKLFGAEPGIEHVPSVKQLLRHFITLNVSGKHI